MFFIYKGTIKVDNKLAANGPAIKLENAAETMEAGIENLDLLDNASEAVMSEARRVFLLSRYLG